MRTSCTVLAVLNTVFAITEDSAINAVAAAMLWICLLIHELVTN